MSVRKVYFTQDCQVCGRPMRVRLELFGKHICCAHCNASCRAGGLEVSNRAGHPRSPGPGPGFSADSGQWRVVEQRASNLLSFG